MCRYRDNIHISGPLPESWLAACMADLTPDLQLRLSWGLIAESFHSLQSLSVSCFHVILGLPDPCFPSTCMSKAVLIAPLERSPCPYHRSLLSFRMRSRSSMPSRTSTFVAHWTWWWQCLATWHCRSVWSLPCHFRCRRWRFGFVNGQVSLAWSIALCTQELYTWPCVLKERWCEERTGSRSLNFFQAVFTHVVVEHSQPPAAESMSSKRKLPPQACQVQPGLPSVVCHPRGVQFPGTVYIYKGPFSRAWAHCISCAPSACSHCSCCCPLQCDRQSMETRLNSAEGPVPYRRSWSLSFLHLLSVLSSPLLLSKSRASWHIPQAIQRW